MPGLYFFNYFYGKNFTKQDKEEVRKYLLALKLRKRGFSVKKLSLITKLPKRRIDHWVGGDSVSPVIRHYQYYLKLGCPKDGCQWLSLNSTRGGLFTGPWVEVPTTVHSFKDIKFVLGQLNTLPEAHKLMKEFGFRRRDLVTLRCAFFFYILGVLLGDGAMCKGNSRRFVTRRITLSLSKRFPTNERLGKYVQLCYNSLGLRMTRTKDGTPSKKNKHKFYRWNGQCSQLIEWISDVCFGLRDEQVKTYSSVRADWLIQSPSELKISFLQGVADSDGYVDLGAHQTGLISKSSISLIENALDSLKVHNNRKYLHGGTLAVTMIGIFDAYALPIFNPIIKSYRFQLLEKMCNAQRPKVHLPEELGGEVTLLLKSGASSIDVVKMLLNKHNLLVREGSIQKRIHKMRQTGG